MNLLGLLLQLFVTSRVIRLMGVRGALFVLPVIALINYSIIVVAPLLAVVRVGKILENSTDYSIQNTLRQALFLPTTARRSTRPRRPSTRSSPAPATSSRPASSCLGQVVGLSTAGLCRHQRRC